MNSIPEDQDPTLIKISKENKDEFLVWCLTRLWEDNLKINDEFVLITVKQDPIEIYLIRSCFSIILPSLFNFEKIFGKKTNDIILFKNGKHFRN